MWNKKIKERKSITYVNIWEKLLGQENLKFGWFSKFEQDFGNILFSKNQMMRIVLKGYLKMNKNTIWLVLVDDDSEWFVFMK